MQPGWTSRLPLRHNRLYQNLLGSFDMNGRDRILAMLEGRPVDRLPLMPITMMFAGDQAGIPYGHYAADHRVMVEAQIAVAEKFDFDYVSAISDPGPRSRRLRRDDPFLRQPAAGHRRGACAPGRQDARCAKLTIPDPLGGGRMHDRVQAVALFRQRVGGQRLIEGWVEGPCAEAADLRGINRLMLDFIDDPAFVRDLFEFVVEMELRFAKAQVEAGADLIGVGDAAASLVGPRIYEEFVRPYEKRLVDGLHAMGIKVRLHICGNTRRILAGIGRWAATWWTSTIWSRWTRPAADMGPSQVVAGNIDPVAAVRNGTPETITAALAECYRAGGAALHRRRRLRGPRDTPEANVRALRNLLGRIAT